MFFLERFPRFIKQEIDETRNAVISRQQRWSDGVTMTSNVPVSMYDCYPYLFLGAFPSLSPTSIRPLAVAARLMATSMVIYDQFMDRTTGSYQATKVGLSLQAMQFEAYDILYSLFPAGSVFWKCFHENYVKYTDACIKEKELASGDLDFSEFTESLALEISGNKAGICRAVIAGLVELAQDDTYLEPLTESINHYAIARQMWDDICDWKEDLRTGIPSLLLSRVVTEWPVQYDQAKLDNLARHIFYCGHANYIMELALESLKRAEALTADIPEIAWKIVIEHLRYNFQTLSKDINKICADNIQRVQSQVVKNGRAQEQISKSLIG